MKQKTITLIIWLFLTVSLIGCNYSQNASDSSTQNSKTQQILQVAPLNSLLDYATSKQGIYIVQPVYPASVNLLYIDAESKKELYLCSLPNCSHNTETCTSYIPLHDGEYSPQIFFHNDFLYLTRGPVNNEYAPSITRINKDGSSRKTIVSLNNGESFRGAVFGYGDSVLMDIISVSENGNNSVYLEKVDLETGARNKLISYKADQSHAYFPMGLTDTELIFIDITEAGHQYFKVNPSSENTSLPDNAAQNPLTEFFDNKNITYTVQNNYLCKYDRLKNQLSYKNLITNEEKTMAVPSLEDGDKLYGIDILFEDVFALGLDDKNGVVVSAILEPNLGSLTGVRIKHTKESSNSPVAIFDDCIIYKMSDREVLLKNQEDEGLINETCYFRVYGYATKENFLNGEAGVEIALPQ